MANGLMTGSPHLRERHPFQPAEHLQKSANPKASSAKTKASPIDPEQQKAQQIHNL